MCADLPSLHLLRVAQYFVHQLHLDPRLLRSTPRKYPISKGVKPTRGNLWINEAAHRTHNNELMDMMLKWF